jgi:hypothetical protein
VPAQPGRARGSAPGAESLVLEMRPFVIWVIHWRVRKRASRSNEAASVSLKVRMAQAVEPQSALSASPMEKWIEGLRSSFESEGGKKPSFARFRPAQS